LETKLLLKVTDLLVHLLLILIDSPTQLLLKVTYSLSQSNYVNSPLVRNFPYDAIISKQLTFCMSGPDVTQELG
jgi:hypothetical protein